ncbi:MAG: glycogen/starch synthase [Muribaculaceae bacterium]|nr:glycogen/starch synthase [Muribaculaceae bacterium]
MNESKVEFDLLFETSWEVCNKVGGIYTVLSTKAKTLQKYYKDKVVFIGPDVWTDENPSPYFIEEDTPLGKWQRHLLLPEGVSVRTGRWDIPGKPIVILVGFNGMYAKNNELFGKMWELFGVDSLHAYGDYGEACAFSHAAALVLEDLVRFKGCTRGKGMIAHFDEWTTGMGLLHLKANMPEIATVFTTPATSIGRSICGNNKPLYDYLKGYNGDQMAAELNMEANHSLEKTAALNADCFTTVSSITARECEQLLGRRPDVVTPNGFEENFVPKKTQYAQARNKARYSMLKVASALTGCQYDDETFITATSGRCEYRNKGIDLYLDSLRRLADIDTGRKVLAFIMVPAWMKQPRTDLMLAIDNSEHKRLVDPVITHELNHPWEDAVLNRIHSIGFSNMPNSRVTTIYVPCYLNGADGIFDMTYYDLLPGMDATVFASYYEPWGYTPLESIAFGVPTVTTTLSGFGQWILEEFDNSFESCGVKVEQRGDFNYDEVKEAIARDLAHLAEASDTETKAIQEAAMKAAAKASWDYFIEYFDEAYLKALTHAAERNK